MLSHQQQKMVIYCKLLELFFAAKLSLQSTPTRFNLIFFLAMLFGFLINFLPWEE